MSEEIAVITGEELAHKLDVQPPANDSRHGGYALVNVLPEDMYRKAHIPDSINIPQGREEEFERRFDREKEIIVYCASPECQASPKAARALVARGFHHVVDYADGLSEWKAAGHPVAAQPR